MHPKLLIVTVLCTTSSISCLEDRQTTLNYESYKSEPRRWNLFSKSEDEKNSKRSSFLDTTQFPDTIENPNNTEEDTESSSSEFNSEALKNFLETYANKFRKPTQNNDIHVDESSKNHSSDSYKKPPSQLPDKEVQLTGDKSKSWDPTNVRQSNNPFENKSGWVSLEAVPWSVSKVSKWESKPDIKPWKNEFDVPKVSSRPQNYPRPNYELEDDRFPRPQNVYSHKQSYSTPRPTYNIIHEEQEESSFYNPYARPSYQPPPTNSFPQKVYIQHYPEPANADFEQRPPVKKYTTQPFKNRFTSQSSDGNHHTLYGDLITDGQPPNFPSYNNYYDRRVSTYFDDHPSTHPENGNVLPPLEDSNVNMTTSHGGLLQVESTFQSVEEAQKQHAENQKWKNRKGPITTTQRPTTKKPWRVWRKKFVPAVDTNKASFEEAEKVPVKAYVPQAIAANQVGPDSTAVLAAVGAGMIPATMAMLVPMAIGGRRRRDTKDFSHNFTSLYH